MHAIPTLEPTSTPRHAAAKPLDCGSPAAALRSQPCWRRRLRALFHHVAAAPAEPGALKHISRPARQQGWLGKAAAGLRAVQGAVRAAALPALLLAPCALLPAAPPPELTVLRTQYEKVLAERVTAPFDAALAELNAKFTTALDNAAAAAKKSGSLPAVLAIEADKKRIAGKLPLPDEDDEQTPDSLKNLRAIYHEQFKKLDDQRTANHGTLLPGYTAKLKELETTLTKADRVDEAKEVMTYREGLATGIAVPTSPPVKSIASSTAAPRVPVADAGPKVSAEDASRQFVEWAVQNGHTATVAGRKGSLVIKTAQDIPKEKFDLLRIESNRMEPHEPPPWRLFQFTPNVDALFFSLWSIKVNPMDVAMLGNLKKLKSIEFKLQMNDVSACIAAMPEFPSLTTLTFLPPVAGPDLAALVRKYPDVLYAAIVLIQPISDEDFNVITGWRKAKLMRFDLMTEALNDANVSALNKMPEVTSLTFFTPKAVPINPATAARLTKIRNVQVHYELPEGTLAGICTMPALESLWFRNIAVLDDAALAPLAAATMLKTLILEGDPKLTDAAVKKVAGALPNLESLSIHGSNGITPDGLATLASLKKLQTLSLRDNPVMADSALDHLKGIRKLKTLTVKSTAMTDAGLAAFKKARPDVKVEK